MESVWKIRQVAHFSSTPTKQRLHLIDGDTMIGTSPSEFWRVLLKLEEPDSGGVVTMSSGWTHQKTPETTSHTLPSRGGSTSPSGVTRIFPTVDVNCGIMQQSFQTLDAKALTKTLDMRIILKLKNMDEEKWITLTQIILTQIMLNQITMTQFQSTRQTPDQKITWFGIPSFITQIDVMELIRSTRWYKFYDITSHDVFY